MHAVNVGAEGPCRATTHTLDHLTRTDAADGLDVEVEASWPRLVVKGLLGVSRLFVMGVLGGGPLCGCVALVPQRSVPQDVVRVVFESDSTDGRPLCVFFCKALHGKGVSARAASLGTKLQPVHLAGDASGLEFLAGTELDNHHAVGGGVVWSVRQRKVYQDWNSACSCGDLPWAGRHTRSGEMTSLTLSPPGASDALLLKTPQCPSLAARNSDLPWPTGCPKLALRGGTSTTSSYMSAPPPLARADLTMSLDVTSSVPLWFAVAFAAMVSSMEQRAQDSSHVHSCRTRARKHTALGATAACGNTLRERHWALTR